MSKINELLERRAQLLAEARTILDKAEGEDRDLSADEQEVYERTCADVDSVDERIERARKLEARAAILDAGGVSRTKVSIDEAESAKAPAKDQEDRAWFTKFLRYGEQALSSEKRIASLQAGADGGYLAAPEQFLSELLVKVDNLVFLRQRATKFRVSGAASLGAPVLDTDVNDATWTSEIADITEDTSLKVGKRVLRPTLVRKLILISRTLARQSAISIEQLVQDRMSYKFGVTEEKGFFLGDGAAEPLGVFTASADGISTGQDVSTDNTTSAVTFDGLINAVESLKQQYQNNSVWFFHRDAIKQLRKIKSAVDGQYIWEPSTQQGSPDRLLGLPFYRSEYVPNTFTSGKYVGILGDFSKYWIAESLTFSLQVLNERYAEKNAIGYIGAQELDGMPVLEEAFIRVKLG